MREKEKAADHRPPKKENIKPFTGGLCGAFV